MPSGVHLQSRIPQVVAALPAAARQGSRDAAAEVKDKAKANAPVGSPSEGDEHAGRLRDSIEEYEQPEGVYVVVRARAGAEEQGAPYGHFVEFGTSKMGPRPFLIPAAEESRADYTVFVGNRIRQVT